MSRGAKESMACIAGSLAAEVRGSPCKMWRCENQVPKGTLPLGSVFLAQVGRKDWMEAEEVAVASITLLVLPEEQLRWGPESHLPISQHFLRPPPTRTLSPPHTLYTKLCASH